MMTQALTARNASMVPCHINFNVGNTLYAGAVVAKDTEDKVRVIDLNKGEIV